VYNVQNVTYGMSEASVLAISEIVGDLISGVQEGKAVDLNALKRDACIKYHLQRAPKLVEIIAAVPEEYRPILLPRCESPASARCSPLSYR
jgi:elongator complex protein 3